jgi:hypothetical protein
MASQEIIDQILAEPEWLFNDKGFYVKGDCSYGLTKKNTLWIKRADAFLSMGPVSIVPDVFKSGALHAVIDQKLDKTKTS